MAMVSGATAFSKWSNVWGGRSPSRMKLSSMPVPRLLQYGFGFQIIPKPGNQQGDHEHDGGGKPSAGPEDPRIEVQVIHVSDPILKLFLDGRRP